MICSGSPELLLLGGKPFFRGDVEALIECRIDNAKLQIVRIPDEGLACHYFRMGIVQAAAVSQFLRPEAIVAERVLPKEKLTLLRGQK
jgi:hypothetical protein